MQMLVSYEAFVRALHHITSMCHDMREHQRREKKSDLLRALCIKAILNSDNNILIDAFQRAYLHGIFALLRLQSLKHLAM